jgi:hypothetical protein
MKTLYVTSLYLLITGLTSVGGQGFSDSFELQNGDNSGKCLSVSPAEPGSTVTLSVVYFDCK